MQIGPKIDRGVHIIGGRPLFVRRTRCASVQRLPVRMSSALTAHLLRMYIRNLAISPPSSYMCYHGRQQDCKEVSIVKRERSSIYIHSQAGEYQHAIMKGVTWLMQLATGDANKRSAVLAVPTVSNLRGDISSVIGDKAVATFGKGQTVLLDNLVEVSLMTERKTLYSCNGPILAIYPTKKLLDQIDSLPGVKDVLVIPWQIQEVQYWIDTWAATELGAAPQVTIRKPVSNPIVEAALEALTERVNLSTGILHPPDRAAAVDLFRILHDNDIPYDPGEIRAWLVSQGGWRPSDADDAKKVAEATLAGKALKGQRRAWSDDILEILEQRANKKQAEKLP